MADSLDMSLDDLISKNKSSSSQSQSRRGRRNQASPSATGGPAPTGRRFHARAATAPYHQLAFHHNQVPPAYAYAAAQAQAMPMLAPPPPSGVETGTKLYISNLDYNVSNEDIKELFSEVGDLKRYSINYDKSGRSKGTAEVVFARRSDALAALKRYNNVQLDGKPMQIEVIGTNIEAPAPAIFTINTPALGIGSFDFPSKSVLGRGGGRGWPRGGGEGGRGWPRGESEGGRGWPRGGGGFGGRGRGGRGAVGRGQGRGGRGSQPVSADDLDADLDKYHSEAMQIS
ncbi:THO complex subunit 4B isoform X2 [Brachypodium distachyon]|uniref:RRM domain-containing protein n=1 Tax=Brachypodium distachyon TaxID=15368 RepID=I1IVC3_BRADI|nr:THO complex subunit 4B isoform X2 [Brachypodium distachyon]KQJ92708.1 hypothetical protein BRADI_4g45380v3 [Brachypodium distachyon]|eukprot:XP_010238843.1 THO complex subunit 4B isoform X2 [Brachypodium distachyon]